MESREITVVDERGRVLISLNSTAETLGDLKSDLERHNISYEEYEFVEGYSRSKLMGNSSPLPKNIQTKDGITNNLMFMLTIPNKKIKSGAYDELLPRQEMYRIIRDENMQEGIKSKYGKSFTTCSNDELKSAIADIRLEREGQKRKKSKGRTESSKVDRIKNIEEEIKEIKEQVDETLDGINSIKEFFAYIEEYSYDNAKEIFSFLDKE